MHGRVGAGRRGVVEQELAEDVFPRRSLTRVLGAQYLLGGALALGWILLPPYGPASGRGAVTSLAVLALLLGSAMIAVSVTVADARVLSTVAHGGILAALVVICLGYAAARDPGSPLLLFVVWTMPYVGIFSRRSRTWHLGLTALAVGAASAAMPAPLRAEAVTYFVFLMSTVLVATLLVSTMTSRLHASATTDPLTGLPNRRSFTRSTRAALARRSASGGSLHVLVLDLDRFKDVNESYGQEVGDVLLLRIAPRLRAALRAGDVVARLGGDEFAVLCEDPTGQLPPGGIAARLSAAWAEPVEVEDRRLSISASTGVATADDGDTPESLLRHADAAMYQAKSEGPGQFRVFDDALQQSRSRLLAVERGLREAAARGELQLQYQPVVTLTGPHAGRVGAAEALLRWTSPELGPVGPDEFIPVAESTGLINALGLWVVDRALRDLAAWRRAGEVDEDFHIAVNVSAHQLTDHLAPRVAALLQRHGVAGRHLGIEITETAVMGGGAAGRVLAELHELGVALFLDDFGTGYSSLSHLRHFPIDVVKVDRSFVAGMCDRPQDRSVVLAVLSLARALGMKVVAEGIETATQAEDLRAAGCAYGQGYWFSRPVPADAFLAAVSGAADRARAATALKPLVGLPRLPSAAGTGHVLPAGTQVQ